jgi:hypothetical protein
VPKLDVIGGGMESFGWSEVKMIKIVVAITSEHLHLGVQVLDREANMIKFHQNKIVTS